MPGDDGTIKLGYDGKKVEAGFASLESRSKKSAKEVEGHFAALSSRIGTSFKNLGTGIAQGIGQSLWSTAIAGAAQLGKEIGGIDYAALIDSSINANSILDNLLDRATKLGTSAESLQRLELFGAINGKAPEEMVDALARLNRSLADVGDNDKARAALNTLNLDVEAFARLEPDQQFIQLARAFQAAEKAGTGLGEIYDLLSRSGGGLLQVLRAPLKDLDELSGAKVIPEEVVLRASEVADELTRAADAKNKAVLQGRAELQLSDEQAKRLKDEAAARKAQQQAVRDAASQTIGQQAVVADQDDPELKREAERKKARADALLTMQQELAILDQRAQGHDKVADAMEREKKLAEDTKKIVEETGLAEADARRAAEARLNLEDKVSKGNGPIEGGSRRKFGSAFDGKRHVIHGYSGAQRDARQKTSYDLSFDEFFGGEAMENGQKPRNPASAFHGVYPDPASGRIEKKAASVNAGGNNRFSMAEGGELVAVNMAILEQLKRITTE